jgi:hypothetical protein
MAKLTKAQWDKRRKERLESANGLPSSGIVEVRIGEERVVGEVSLRTFASGSVGYYANIRGFIGDLPVNGSFPLVVTGTAPYSGKA